MASCFLLSLSGVHRDRFCNVLNMVHIGLPTSNSGLCLSMYEVARALSSSLLKSHPVVRSIASPALMFILVAILVTRGGLYISAISTFNLSKSRSTDFSNVDGGLLRAIMSSWLMGPHVRNLLIAFFRWLTCCDNCSSVIVSTDFGGFELALGLS